MPSTILRCKCGASVRSDALDGLCPACMVALVLESPNGYGDEVAVPDGCLRMYRHFGDYELLEEIAHGGMGVVYKARQLSLNRVVAVKMLLAGQFASRSFVERFYVEARVAANLQHRNIVAIHEVGEHDGQHYFSMEYVDGQDLSEWTRRGPLLPGIAANYVQSIARAIQFAHQRGILHRDLKPSNVLIDEFGQPRVTDFGLARWLHDDSSLTLTGQTLGSPGYIAPEQVSAKRDQVGVAADIYSLGAILYHLLTGRAPFWAETVQGTLALLLNHEPVPPRTLNPGISRDLETICMKCLEKEPQRRYPSAEALAEDLERWLAGEAIQARPIRQWERGWKWAKRYPVSTGLVLLVMLVFLTGLLGVVWQWQRAETFAHQESRQRHRAEGERARAEAAVNRLEIERAELLFGNDRAAEAIAHLAAVVRKDPANRIAAARTVSALTERSFAFPSVPPLAHAGPVAWTAFSPDGGQIVTASHDNTARLWSAADGTPLAKVLIHDGPVHIAEISPDGRIVATGSADKTARLWDRSTGDALGAPLQHENEVTFLEFSPDGKLLLTVAKDVGVRIWELETMRNISLDAAQLRSVCSAHFSSDSRKVVTATRNGVAQAWEAHTGKRAAPAFHEGVRLWSSRFHPDGTRVVTASDTKAKIWDAQTGAGIGEILDHRQVVHDAMFSPDGALLLTISRDGTARVWDAQTLKPVFEPFRHRTWVTSAQFSADGLRVLTTADDKTVRVWSLITGKASVEPIHLGAHIRHARLSPNGKHLATASQHNAAQLWDIHRGKSAATVIRTGNQLFGASSREVATFNADSQRLLTCSLSGDARIWNRETGEVMSRMPHRNGVREAAFSPDERTVTTASLDNTAAIWDWRTGRRLHLWTNHSSRVRRATFSADGRYVLTVSFDKTAWVWNATNYQAVSGPLRHDGRVWYGDFSPDGTRVVTGEGHPFESGKASIWDTLTGRRLHELPHENEVYIVKFSPDGKAIATGSSDRTTRIWDAQTGRLRNVLIHASFVAGLEFSPDGRWLATASGDSAQLWDVTSGASIGPQLHHGGHVYRVRFSPDGRLLATTSEDHTARLWSIPGGNPITEPYRHSDAVCYAAFSPDGHWLVTVDNQGRAHIWEVSVMLDFEPRLLAGLAEAVGGLHVDESNELKPTPAGSFARARREIELSQRSKSDVRSSGANADQSWSIWASWILADRSERSISPRSSVPWCDLIQRRVRENTITSLTEALEYDPANGVALARLTRLTVAQGTNLPPGQMSLLNFYSLRAVALAQDDAESWWARARVLETKGDIQSALAAMQRGSECKPAEPEFWWELAGLLEAQHKGDEALAALSRAVDLTRDSEHPPSKRHCEALLKRRELLLRLNRPTDAQADLLEAKAIPARDSRVSPSAVDLSAYYNAALDEEWHNPTNMLGGWSLENLPSGRQVLDGIEFDIRGIIQLSGSKLAELAPQYPARVGQIQIRRRCKVLYFLHASVWSKQVETGTEIGRYTVHYSDGRTEVLPIIHGEDALEWQIINDDVSSLKNAKVVWSGKTPGGVPIRLFKRTWRHPRPDVEIASIDFTSAMTLAAPFVIAISTEP